MKERNWKSRDFYVLSYAVVMFSLVIVSIVTLETAPFFSHCLDVIIWGIFLCDTLYRMVKSHHYWQFIKRHPFDMIALIPVFNGFRLFKFIPLIMLLIRDSLIGERYILPFIANFAKEGMGRIITVFSFIFFLLPIPLIFIEPNMKHYSEALWWALQTVTTVGYGDIVPETMFGRLIAAVLMILGIGLISAIISTLTRVISGIGQDKPKEKSKKATQDVEVPSWTVEDIERLQQLLEAEKQRLQKKSSS